MPLEAWIYSIAAAALFGLSLNLAQIGLRYMPVALGSMISIPTAAVLFWLSSPWTADFSGWRNDAALLFAVTGLFYPAVVTILTFEATRFLGPNVTAAMGNLAPVVAVAAGVLWLGEALGARQFAGIAVLVAGVTLMTTNRNWGDSTWPLWRSVFRWPLPCSAGWGNRCSRSGSGGGTIRGSRRCYVMPRRRRS